MIKLPGEDDVTRSPPPSRLRSRKPRAGREALMQTGLRLGRVFPPVFDVPSSALNDVVERLERRLREGADELAAP
jgi:hypothetical protein